MQVVEQSHEILTMDGLEIVERAGRTCYKSEDKITDDSAESFVRMLIKRKHDAMLEHGKASVRFVTNRGITHELVRHRLCSFGQESTRYVNYGGADIAFIRPVWCAVSLPGVYNTDEVITAPFGEVDLEWLWTVLNAEKSYNELLKLGWPPEQAREVLPNSLKTEIVVTANYREWRHILCLRALGTTGRPHPQMKALMDPLLVEFKERLPAMFGDLV